MKKNISTNKGAEKMQNVEHQIISEDKFIDIYDPSDVIEHKETLKIPLENVWTLIDGDDGNIYAVAGYHIVNKIDYVITKKEWKTGDETAMWFESEEE